MPKVWIYPWHLTGSGADRTFDRLVELGIDGIDVATHYHSIQTLNPRTPESLFTRYPGGCFFEPDSDAFRATDIDPSTNAVSSLEDPLAAITEAAADYDLDVNAWTVCLHNSSLCAANPKYRVESAFGDAHGHSFCPSHPEVRAYFRAVASSYTNYDLTEICLESIGFPSFDHPHGADFGHSKNHAITGRTEQLLLSQCFCEGCQSAAKDHRVDIYRARTVVRELCRQALSSGEPLLAPMPSLLDEYPALEDLFAFRASVIDTLLSDIAEASGGLTLNYYMADGFGRDPGDGWPAGVVLETLPAHLDRITALCYTDNPDIARRRVADLQAATKLPVDAGITLDPAVLPDEETYREVLTEIQSVLQGDVRLYNYGLLTDDHLAWVRSSSLPHSTQERP